MNSTYSIKASKLPAMHRAVAQIQRRAAKLGVQAPVVTVGQPYDAYFTPTHSSPRRVPSADVADYRAKGRTLFVVPYVDVQVEGEPVKLAGWTFVAALEHLTVDGESANLLRVSPRYDGPALPERFRTETPENCDHCHKRIRRLETFVVHSEAEGWRQVGRNCLRDFLGGADPQAAVARLEWELALADFFGADEDGGFGEGGPNAVSIEGFLAQVAACCRVDGYTSRAKARDCMGASATADDVLALTIRPPRPLPDGWKAWAEKRAITDADTELAAKVLEYARGESLQQRAARAEDDFAYNLWVAGKQSAVTPKLAGISAYLVPFYQREVERQVRAAQDRENLGASKHVGSEGERVLLKVRILHVRTVGQDSQWGESRLHKALTEGGDVVVWFDRSDRDALEVGSTHHVKGTITRHGEYNGVKETTLNRVSVLTPEAAEAERKKAEKKAKRAAKVAAITMIAAA